MSREKTSQIKSLGKATQERVTKSPKDTSRKPNLVNPGTETGVENKWSEWIWDLKLQIYYRAKKEVNGVWNYEYAEIEQYHIIKESDVPGYCKFPSHWYTIEKQAFAFQNPPTYTLKEKNGEYILAVDEHSVLATDNGKAEVPQRENYEVEKFGKEVDVKEKTDRLEADVEGLPNEQQNDLKQTKEKRTKRRRGRSRGPKKLSGSFALAQGLQ